MKTKIIQIKNFVVSEIEVRTQGRNTSAIMWLAVIHLMPFFMLHGAIGHALHGNIVSTVVLALASVYLWVRANNEELQTRPAAVVDPDEETEADVVVVDGEPHSEDLHEQQSK